CRGGDGGRPGGGRGDGGGQPDRGALRRAGPLAAKPPEIDPDPDGRLARMAEPEGRPVAPPPVAAFDHVPLGVWSVEPALRLYRDLLGGEIVRDAPGGSRGFRFVQLRYPNGSKLEILEPDDANDESNFLVRFLRTRGEGIHHLTYYVCSLEEAVAGARAA